MSIDLATLKVAIVHYWLFEARGGEKVLEALCELFPGADIFTHILDRKMFSESRCKAQGDNLFYPTAPIRP